jgi:lipoprotein-anchoring transpeptidase ErfK/SrfK
MIRRRGVLIGVAAGLLLFITLGSAGAHQIWSASQAHSAWLAERSATASDLRHATALGLDGADLNRLSSTRDRLESAPVPSANVLWSSAQADFFSAQKRSYSALDREIRKSLAADTRSTHRQALAAQGKLGDAVLRGATLQVDTSTAARALAANRADLLTAHSPRANRQIAGSLASVAAALERQIAAKEHRVDAIVSASGGSLSVIQQGSQAAVSSAQSQLALLALFTKQAASDTATITRLEAAVQAQSSARAAAIDEVALEDEGAAITAQASRMVPQKLIVVSTEDQTAWMYENGVQVYTTPVTTGGPELPTDHGIFHIYLKESPFEFHSPWPVGSPYYYPPTPVSFWMPFDGAEGLHDASWRSNFGPGSNYQPTDLGTGYYILGTHGCVNLPYDAAQWVWDWAPVGTTVVVD